MRIKGFTESFLRLDIPVARPEGIVHKACNDTQVCVLKLHTFIRITQVVYAQCMLSVPLFIRKTCSDTQSVYQHTMLHINYTTIFVV